MTLDEKIQSGQWPIQARLHWYRFGKLTKLGCRYAWQIPLGKGWIFDTYEHVLDIELPEDGRFDPWRHKIYRQRKHWDRFVLPIARCFLRLFPKPHFDSDLLWNDKDVERI